MPETVAPPAAAVPEARPKPAANTAYKRQISEAIPRNERLNAGRAGLEEGDHTYTGSDGGAGRAGQEEEDHTHTGGDGGAGTGIRRSGRARKPKQRN